MTAFIFGVWLSGPLPVKFLVVGKGDGEEDAFLRKVFGRLSPWGVEKKGGTRIHLWIFGANLHLTTYLLISFESNFYQ